VSRITQMDLMENTVMDNTVESHFHISLSTSALQPRKLRAVTEISLSFTCDFVDTNRDCPYGPP
jgi:hypothetical protein